MKVNQDNLELSKFQEMTIKFSEVNLLSRRVERLKEELEYNTSGIIIDNELRLIKEQIKKVENLL